jgi:hypothetical protein
MLEAALAIVAMDDHHLLAALGNKDPVFRHVFKPGK